MKLITLLSLLVISTSAFSEVYKRFDTKRDCMLFYSTFSEKYFEQGTTDKRASIAPGLNFEKFEGQYNLKGLWSFVPLVHDVDVEDRADFFMTHEFTHACVSEEGKIIEISEPRRKLLNNWNDYDRQ